MRTGADGIALSCDGTTLYWTPLTSRTLYSVSVDTLLMYKPFEQVYINESIVAYEKGFASDGLAGSSNHILYMTDIENSAIRYIKEDTLATESAALDNNITSIVSTLVQDSNGLCWPDTLGFDSDGWMYIVANNLCQFIQGKISNYSAVNYQIWKVYVNADSYVKGCAEEPRTFGKVETIIFSTYAGAWVVGLMGVIAIYWINRKCLGFNQDDYNTNLRD